MRLPKRGFNNARFRKEFATINVKDLARFESGETVTPESLVDSGIIKRVRDGVKVLGDGDLKVSLTVKAHGFSQSAVQKIEAAGGKVEVI